MDEERPVTVKEVLSLVSVSSFQNRLTVLCSAHIMSDAVEVSLVGFLAVILEREWRLTPYEVGTIAGVVFSGQLVGAVFWGPFAEKFGRRPSFLIGAAVIGIAGLLSSIATEIYSLLVFRALVGAAISSGTIAFDLLAEFMSDEVSDKYLMFLLYSFTVGGLLSAGFAWLLIDSTGWRFYLVACSLPALVTWLVACFVLPESPLWLATKARFDDAKDVLKGLAKVNGDDIDIDKMRVVGAGEENHDQTDNSTIPLGHSMLKRIFGLYYDVLFGSYWWTSFIVLSMYALSGFSYFGLILLVTRINTVDTAAGDSVTFNYLEILINSLWELAGVLFGSELVRRVGLMRGMIISYALAGVFVAMMSLPIAYSPGVSICLAGLARLGSIANYNILWAATPNLFPTKLRTTAHSVANGAAKLAAALSPYASLNRQVPIVVVGILFLFCNLLNCRLVWSLQAISSKLRDAPRQRTLVVNVNGEPKHDYSVSNPVHADLQVSSELRDAPRQRTLVVNVNGEPKHAYSVINPVHADL